MLGDPTALAPSLRQRQGNRVIDGFGLAGNPQDDCLPVFAEAQAKHLHPPARLRHLIADDLVAGPNHFETVPGADMLAGFDPDLLARVDPIRRIQWAVEGNSKFVRGGGPGKDRLRQIGAGITYFKYAP